MKVRHGFVSNSSSSSFLIKSSIGKIKSSEDFEKLLPFSVDSFRYKRWSDKEYTCFSRKEVSDAVFRDLKPLTIEEAFLYDRNSGWTKEEYEWREGDNASEKFTEDDIIEFMNSFLSSYNKIDEAAIKHLGSKETVINIYRNHFFFYSTSASDEDGGFWGTIEHNILPTIANKRYSHH